MSHTKSALMLTGSGGTLSQEVAIIDQLIQKNKIEINQKHTMLFASGTSTINAVAINACFCKNSSCSWENYYKNIFLETLSDDEIYMKVHPVQWSTHAMRNKLKMLLDKAGFNAISELPFLTSLLISSSSRTKTTWMKSRSAKHENGDLCDILMASSAIPVLFPPQVINSIQDLPLQIKEGTYQDGNSNGIFFNFRKQLKKIISTHHKIDELFIISPQRTIDPASIIAQKFSGMTMEEQETFGDFLNHISLNGFLAFLLELQVANKNNKIAGKIYVTIPETLEHYPLLDFNNQGIKYQTIYNWFDQNPDKLAVELETFCERISLIPSPTAV